MSNSCDDVNKALSALNGKIDKLNQCCISNRNKLVELEKRIKDLEQGNSNNKDKPQNLSDIYKRLAKIENYINSLDSTGDTIKQSIEQIIQLLTGD